MNEPLQWPVGSELDAEVISEHVHWIEPLFPDRIVILCHFKHNTAPFVSSSCKGILGYSKKEFESFTPEFFFSLIHPDDIDSVTKGFKGIQEWPEGTPFYRLRFILYYRIKHKSGNYIHMRDERITLLTKNNHQIFFILLNKVDFPETNNIEFEVFEIVKSGLRKLKIQTSTNANSLTPREHEMILLISKGLSSKEIAYKLSISLSTVKKHRYNLFKKTNAKNSHSLINFAKTNQ